MGAEGATKHKFVLSASHGLSIRIARPPASRTYSTLHVLQLANLPFAEFTVEFTMLLHRL